MLEPPMGSELGLFPVSTIICGKPLEWHFGFLSPYAMAALNFSSATHVARRHIALLVTCARAAHAHIHDTH